MPRRRVVRMTVAPSGAVAAPDVPARGAPTQPRPGPAHGEALRAALADGSGRSGHAGEVLTVTVVRTPGVGCHGPRRLAARDGPPAASACPTCLHVPATSPHAPALCPVSSGRGAPVDAGLRPAPYRGDRQVRRRPKPSSVSVPGGGPSRRPVYGGGRCGSTRPPRRSVRLRRRERAAEREGVLEERGGGVARRRRGRGRALCERRARGSVATGLARPIASSVRHSCHEARVPDAHHSHGAVMPACRTPGRPRPRTDPSPPPRSRPPGGQAAAHAAWRALPHGHRRPGGLGPPRTGAAPLPVRRRTRARRPPHVQHLAGRVPEPQHRRRRLCGTAPVTSFRPNGFGRELPLPWVNRSAHHSQTWPTAL